MTERGKRKTFAARKPKRSKFGTKTLAERYAKANPYGRGETARKKSQHEQNEI